MQSLYFSYIFTIRIDYIKYKSYKSSQVKTNGTFWCSECSAMHMLSTVNSTVGKKLKSKQKWRSCPDQSKKDTYEIWYSSVSCISPKSMGLKITDPLFSLLHTIQCRSKNNFIQQLSNVCTKVITHEYCPEIHKAHIG